MKAILRRLAAGLVACLAAALLAGCGSRLPSMVPVSGKVTVGGQSLTAGQVTLVPQETNKPAAGLSAGTIDANGEYVIHTAGQAGAPPGKYKVTVTPSMVPTPGAKSMPKLFDARYQNANTTPLSFEVVPNAPPGAYDLKLAK